MPAQPPQVDARTPGDVKAQVIRLARRYAPEWQLVPGDPGTTLLAVYAHYLEIMLDRLNRVPEKDLLVFLDLMGIGLLPPGAARTTLVFSLAATAGEARTVASGTQVATVQSETQPAVVFETLQDLNVIAARLAASFTVNPRTDRWADRTPMVSGLDPAVFPPFDGDLPLDHLLYLGADQLLLVRAGTLEVTVTAAGAAPADWQNSFDPVEWEAFRAGAWEQLPAPAIMKDDPRTARLVFTSFTGADLTAGPPAADVPGPGRWIRGRLRFPRSEYIRITTTGAALTIDPPLRVPHAMGAPLVRLQPHPGTALAARVDSASGSITVASGAGLGQADAIMLDTAASAEFLTLGPVPPAPAAVTIPVTPATRLPHGPGAVVTRLTVPGRASVTTLAAAAPAGTRSISPASTAGLAVGDVMRIGNPVGADPLTSALAVDAIGVYVGQASALPDHALVSGVPADATGTFLPLGPDPGPGDSFALASEEAFAKVERGARLPSGGQVRIAIEYDPSPVTLTWQYFREGWETLTPLGDDTDQFRQDGVVTLPFFPRPKPIDTLPGHEETLYYLFRVHLDDGGYRRIPRIQSLTFTSEREVDILTFTSEREVDIFDPNGKFVSLTGLTPVDTNLPYFPFGTSPRIGNTLTLGLPASLLDGKNSVELSVLLAQTALLRWEYSSTTGWRWLGDSSPRSQSIAPTEAGFSDTSLAFIRAGVVSFRRPADFAPIEAGGQAGYWVRARLVSGEYGEAARMVPAVPGDPTKGFLFRQGTGSPNPPIADRVTLTYEADTAAPSVFTRNGFGLEDRSALNARGVGAYRPFEPEADAEPAFYLGLDRAPPNDSITMYLASPPREYIEPLPAAEAGASASAGGKRLLDWEYWNGTEWSPLATSDDTLALAQSGIVRFVGPADMAPLGLFDEPTPRYWIRVRRLDPGDDVPVLSGVFLNAVESEQAATIRGEVVGSSNGQAAQVFRVARPPVFAGQAVTVLEPELPPEEEQTAIREEEGDDAIFAGPGSDGRLIGVRWHEVATFARSGPRSRHYTLDRHAGEFRFGDGVNGLIPPAGRDNVVVSSYRSGGGPQGNQSAGAVTQLKTSIPYVASVTNPEPADGGAAAEDIQGVLARGPQLLRNRRRAVTPDDYEWLAREIAGTRVARARALPGRDRALNFAGGWVTLIVVPQGTERKLLPSAQLVRELEDGLASLSLATLTGPAPARINVIGPGYVPVECAAEVVTADPTAADAARRGALAAIDAFLHPLTGGPDGGGWEFGRNVYLSEIFAVLEAVPAVDHVRSLVFLPTVGAVPLTLSGSPQTAPADYAAGTPITTDDASVTAVITEPIGQGTVLTQAMVVVFREGEQVRLGTDTGAVSTTVRGISGATLTVDPFRARRGYPAGTVVGSADGTARSVLTTAIEPEALISQLPVRGFAPGDALVFPGAQGAAGPVVPLATTGSQARRSLVLGRRLRVPEFHLTASGASAVTVS